MNFLNKSKQKIKNLIKAFLIVKKIGEFLQRIKNKERAIDRIQCPTSCDPEWLIEAVGNSRAEYRREIDIYMRGILRAAKLLPNI